MKSKKQESIEKNYSQTFLHLHPKTIKTIKVKATKEISRPIRLHKKDTLLCRKFRISNHDLIVSCIKEQNNLLFKGYDPLTSKEYRLILNSPAKKIGNMNVKDWLNKVALKSLAIDKNRLIFRDVKHQEKGNKIKQHKKLDVSKKALDTKHQLAPNPCNVMDQRISKSQASKDDVQKRMKDNNKESPRTVEESGNNDKNENDNKETTTGEYKSSFTELEIKADDDKKHTVFSPKNENKEMVNETEEYDSSFSEIENELINKKENLEEKFLSNEDSKGLLKNDYKEMKYEGEEYDSSYTEVEDEYDSKNMDFEGSFLSDKHELSLSKEICIPLNSILDEESYGSYKTDDFTRE